MAESPLLVSRQGAIATLQFNRPEAMNALDLPTALALRDAVRAIAHDASVRAVLLRGSGRVFVAGGDLVMLAADPVRADSQSVRCHLPKHWQHVWRCCWCRDPRSPHRWTRHPRRVRWNKSRPSYSLRVSTSR